MARYLNDWASMNWDGETGEAAMLREFAIDKSEIDGAEVLVASSINEGYDGSAYVLFRRGGRLFEVHAAHHSHYGLDGQWIPEEADADAILHRIEKGKWGEEANVKEAVIEALRKQGRRLEQRQRLRGT